MWQCCTWLIAITRTIPNTTFDNTQNRPVISLVRKLSTGQIKCLKLHNLVYLTVNHFKFTLLTSNYQLLVDDRVLDKVLLKLVDFDTSLFWFLIMWLHFSGGESCDLKEEKFRSKLSKIFALNINISSKNWPRIYLILKILNICIK